LLSANDLRTKLFESLWDIPEGISYNAYLLIDDRTVLVDGFKGMYADLLIDKVKELLGGRRLDYYIVHHGEPDHSGSFPYVVKEFPEVRVLTTDVGLKILRNLYDVSFNYDVVSDGYELKIGGRTLKFIHAPWLHWPDTYVTYLVEDKVLFSCDAFGSYGLLTAGYWDRDYGDIHMSLSKRYFANIVARYRGQVIKAIDKLSKYEVNVIAPAHGPLIGDVGSAIRRYLSWSKPVFDSKVVIIYSSMYGNLEEAIKYVVKGVEEVRAKAVLMKVPDTAITYVFEELLDAPSIALGVPTYDGNVFPYIKLVTHLMTTKMLDGRHIGIVSSGLWAPVVEAKLIKDLEEVKAVIEGKVSILGRAKESDKEKLIALGRSLGIKALELSSTPT